MHRKKDALRYTIWVIFPWSLTANLPILFHLFSYSLKQKFLLTCNLITQRSWSSEDQLPLVWQRLHFINMTQNQFLSPHAVGFLPLAVMVFFFFFSGTLLQRKIYSHLKESVLGRGRWSQLLVTYARLESNVWKMGFWISRDFTVTGGTAYR